MDRKIQNIVNKVLSEKISGERKRRLFENKEMCTECGKGSMVEGMCSECGYMGEDMCSECGSGGMVEGMCSECGYTEGEFKESKKLSKGQQYIAKQAKPYHKIDAEDFRVLRSKKKKNMNEVSDEFGYEMQEPCPHCNGTGYNEFDHVECEWFEGPGEDDEYGDLKISDDMPSYKTKWTMPRPSLSDLSKSMDDSMIDDEPIYDKEDWNTNFSKDYRDPMPKGWDDLEESECVECGYMEEGETEEGNKFTYELELAREKGKKEFSVDGKKYPVKESYQFSENEMINFIERIVEEEKKFRAGKEPKGYREYDKAHRQDKKINDEYVESVVKKMKDYLKTGSKGKFSFDPKIFPAGNGELAEMEKMAYVPSDAVGEYIENFTAAALENIDYDTFKTYKDWVDDNIVGSSRTGNNPKWANAVETPTNKRRKEIKDKNLWRKTELKAYNKAPQPVYKETAGNSKDGSSNIMKALESEDRSNKKLTEEFNRMKNLIGYSTKTQ